MRQNPKHLPIIPLTHNVTGGKVLLSPTSPFCNYYTMGNDFTYGQIGAEDHV